MPALPNVPNVFRLEYHWTISEDTFAKSRAYYRYTGTPLTQADANGVAGAVVGFYTAQFKPLATAPVILTSVQVVDLSSATGVTGIVAANVVGTNANDKLPADVCALVKFSVARRYRGGHPRIYFPFFGDGDMLDQQQWKPASVAALQAAYNAVQTNILGTALSAGAIQSQVNVSYYSGFHVVTGSTGRARNVSTPRGAAEVDTVTAFTAQPGIASQRRRLLRLA